MLPGDRLKRRPVETLAGSRTELERLEVFALGDDSLVIHIQGIAGVGKTHLLWADLKAEFAGLACSRRSSSVGVATHISFNDGW